MKERQDGAVAEALAAFFGALNDLDRERMDACFTDGATNFRPNGGPRLTEFWGEPFETWRTTRPGPPYLNISPKDLLIEEWGDVALATFHLDQGPEVMGRRTLVLRRMADGWKIAHVHASNLPRIPAPV